MPFDGTTLNGTAVLLLSARQYIVENGWVQDEIMDEAGAVCAVGALRQVGCGSPHFEDAIIALGGVVGIEIPTRYCGGLIGFWNDDPARTVSEILDAFDRAAAKFS